MTKVSVRRLVRIALFAAVLCLIAPVRVDIGPVPITLQTLFIALAGAILGCADGTICLAIYLLMGLCGLPVFAGWTGGFSAFAGPTGGYLLAFPVLATLEGTRRLWAGLLGLAIVDVVGAGWFMILSGSSLGQALMIAVVPFLIKDVLSVIVAHLGAQLILRRIGASGR